MKEAFLDANVVLRHLSGDPEEMAGAALKTFAAAERGELRLRLLGITVAEVVWVLESFYGHGREEIAVTLAEFLQADGLQVEQRDRLMEALTLYREHGVDFADAVVAAAARRAGAPDICSFDRDFDGLPGLTRLAPG